MNTKFDQAAFDKYAAGQRAEAKQINASGGFGGQDYDPEYQIERNRRFYRYVDCPCDRRVYVPNFTNYCACGREGRGNRRNGGRYS